MRTERLLELEREDSEADIQALVAVGGGTPPSAVVNGCTALMLAVLEDGIRSALSPIPQVRREAEAWLENRRARGPFAFAALCETFGLEPHDVRAAILRMRPAAGSSQGFDAPQRRRSRPNVRRVPALRNSPLKNACRPLRRDSGQASRRPLREPQGPPQAEREGLSGQRESVRAETRTSASGAGSVG